MFESGNKGQFFLTGKQIQFRMEFKAVSDCLEKGADILFHILNHIAINLSVFMDIIAS